MNLDENILKRIISEVIRQIQSENSEQNFSVSDKKMYVILTENWDERYLDFYKKIENQNKYNIFTIIPETISNDYFIKKIKNYKNCGTIISQNKINFEQSKEYITVFPVVTRDILVKTALCISDTFETKWIENCISNGQKIIMLKSGITNFTGKEPKKYIEKINSYFNMILDYGIEITDDILKSESEKVYIQNTEKRNKRIITEKEIDLYKEKEKLILYPGDIITSLAAEKAYNMGIDIIKQ